MAARCDICGKEKALRPERLACQQQDKAGVPRESQARARKGTRKGGQLQGLHTLHQGLQDRKAVALKKRLPPRGVSGLRGIKIFEQSAVKALEHAAWTTL